MSSKPIGGCLGLVNIGFGNYVAASRLVALIGPDSAPIKRLVQEARDQGRLIDGTCGRRTRAVLVTDSDHVVLCAVHPETVAHRLCGKDAGLPLEEELEEEKA